MARDGRGGRARGARRPQVIVADASAVVELLLGRAATLRQSLLEGQQLAAPHLLDAEVAQTLRRFVLAGSLNETAAGEALSDLGALPLTRYAHSALLLRAFALRDVTVYDGLYLALAEVLEIPLLTGDAALASVPGCAAEVQLLTG